MEEIDYYLKAGKISAEALKKAAKLVKPGEKLIKVVEEIEEFIKKQAGLAFPVNVSINEIAAHDTAMSNDERTFEEKDVVKIDVGAEVNGFIGDNALTIDLSGENQDLVEAAELALENALSIAKAGVTSNQLSKEIEETITSKGFKPVANLGGHVLEKNTLHSGLSIPNKYYKEGFVLEEGMAIAIEPFASTGSGYVREGQRTEIFMLLKEKPVRGQNARKALQIIKEKYPYFPFSERWIAEKIGVFQAKMALRELSVNEIIHPYPILRDIRGSLVSQREKTIIIEKDSCLITT